MNLQEYEFPVPAPGTKLGEKLSNLANQAPHKFSRLVTALEDFIRDPAQGTRICPVNDEEAKAEVYLTPPRFILHHLPDAALLVRLDHVERRIDVVEVVEEYGGAGEEAQWRLLEASARDSLRPRTAT